MRWRWGLGVAVVFGALAVWLGAAPASRAGGYVVTAECTSSGRTAPCGTGWYTSGVSLSWTWSPMDGGNPAAGCVPHSYVSDTSTTVSCTISGPSGQTTTSEPLRVETSTPAVSVGLSRSADSGGWYTRPVAATVSGTSFSGMASCAGTSYSGPDTTGATVKGSCTDKAGKTATATSLSFKYEASTPTVTVGLARAPDSHGWYTHPVTATVKGSSVSGIASCMPGGYAGPDASQAVLRASCTDNAGKTVTAMSAPFRYEGSSPTISVVPSRPPDSLGWFNHPVTAAVRGRSFSGIAACAASTYGGPDTSIASVAGTCTDNAGKTVRAISGAFRYDASAPVLKVTADAGDRIVVLHWAAADLAPLSSLKVVRSSAAHGAAERVVHGTHGDSYTDRRVRNGVRYRYTVTATDQAGNTGSASIVVRPGLRILAPLKNALVPAPPLLEWTAVRGAAYYNVQLYRGRAKILSAWPARPIYQLRASWSFGRHRRGLHPGRYRWYVWPGFGPRAADRYGPAIGSGTFILSHSSQS